jgi:hypothetical protein
VTCSAARPGTVHQPCDRGQGHCPRPLRDTLTRLGVTVWPDEAEMRIGHNLRRKIDDGIRSSRFRCRGPDFGDGCIPERWLDPVQLVEHDPDTRDQAAYRRTLQSGCASVRDELESDSSAAGDWQQWRRQPASRTSAGDSDPAGSVEVSSVPHDTSTTRIAIQGNLSTSRSYQRFSSARSHVQAETSESRWSPSPR